MLRDLRLADRAAFTELMATAFAPDPLFVRLFAEGADAERAQARRRALFEFLFDRCAQGGCLARGAFVAGRLRGGCLVEDSARHERVLPLLRGVAHLLARLPLGTTARLNDYMRLTRRQAPGVRHHYLTIIGVDATMQGQGIGRRLLEELIERARRQPGVRALALDTENPRNVGLYEHFGFRPAAQVPVAGVTAHCMVLTL